MNAYETIEKLNGGAFKLITGYPRAAFNAMRESLRKWYGKEYAEEGFGLKELNERERGGYCP